MAETATKGAPRVPVIDPDDCPDTPTEDIQPVDFYVGKYAGITSPFIHEQIKKRRVCAWKIGGRWFISEAEFIRFASAGRNV